MKRFLMCAPEHFDVRYVINPWMHGNLGKVDKALASSQWQALHRIVSARAAVTLIDPVEGLPDMVFTANAGLVHGDQVIVSAFRHAERQPESPHFGRFFSSLGFEVHHLSLDTAFEGAGDALFDSAGRLWLGSGFRSDAYAQEGIQSVFDVEIHPLELIDPHWYHLDICFCPLPQGGAMAWRGAFGEGSAAALEAAFGKDLIWVSEQDAKDFACNAVVIGHDVVLHRASNALKAALAQRGLQVIETDMSEFLKSGGSCKCLTLEL